jgi:2-phospho-L-lactate transferase/gluconeogenesis factor (CofD/UPF0052 family)
MAIKVAVFCGGRGSATIIRALLKSTEVQLALLVNAYDDGLSTGALREFIPGMLGPSDFRKNFSYLLNLYSDEQYALKSVVEFRLPMTFGPTEVAELRNFVQRGEARSLADPLGGLIACLSEAASAQVRQLLSAFLQYVDTFGLAFDFRDCAVGNLLFAGAYLSQGRNFNAAAEVMSRLVCSQAVLVNVSNGENRILVALKENGELLRHEVEIVGQQSTSRISKLFFLPEQIGDEELAQINQCKVVEKYKWLAQRQSLPVLSEEARRFLLDACIVIYGPGTQHSSLLPSYMIAAPALKASRAPIKAMVVNLRPDNDIHGFKASDLVDRALACMDDSDNSQRTITHILLDNSRPIEGILRLQPGTLGAYSAYKGAAVVRAEFENKVSPEIHNGRAVVSKILNLWQRHGADDESPSLEIFYDLSQRRAAGASLVEEFLEEEWSETFRRVVLRVRGETPTLPLLPPHLAIEQWQADELFPEVAVTAHWLRAGGSDYLATITGDGEYRLRDIVFGVRVLEQSSFGTLFGSRTQSRRQFNSSLLAAYGERGFAYRASLTGAFLLSMLFAARFGVIFSDPISGFRIYRRSKLQPLETLLLPSLRMTPTTITRVLLENRIEIAELPVAYRTFAGFTDPKGRLRRGMSNLLGIFR